VCVRFFFYYYLRRIESEYLHSDFVAICKYLQVTSLPACVLLDAKKEPVNPSVHSIEDLQVWCLVFISLCFHRSNLDGCNKNIVPLVSNKPNRINCHTNMWQVL
jgi:hypothetical protein